MLKLPKIFLPFVISDEEGNEMSAFEFKSKLNDTDISEDDENEDDEDEVLVDANAIDQIVGGGVILVNAISTRK